MRLVKFTFAVIVIVIIASYYNDSKRQTEVRRLDKYNLIQEYLLNPGKAADKKPILWIHNNYKINARNWDNFGSRNTRKLNQPYLYLCVKSIIKHCGASFNVVLIDDNSFKKLIPNWNVSMSILSDPITTHMRLVGLSKLLYYFGGMIVPSSTIAVRDFLPVYNEGVSCHGCFTTEIVNRTSASRYKEFFPSIKIMGCKKNNEIIKNMVNYLEVLALQDYTSESDFLGEANRWLYEQTAKRRMYLTDGKKFGVKTICGKAVNIEDLLGNGSIEFDKRVLVGIYIPGDELLKRTNYQWFARLSEEQTLKAETIFSKHLLLSLGRPTQDCGVVCS